MKIQSICPVRLLRCGTAGLALSAALLSAPAMAQASGETPQAERDADDGTIIVTATRRSEAPFVHECCLVPRSLLTTWPSKSISRACEKTQS